MADTAAIIVPTSFKIEPVDAKFESEKQGYQSINEEAVAPLGPVLSEFRGTFVGNGLNTIFRPNTTTKESNLLELNLTKDTISFSKPLGNIPNRGSGSQQDIFLNGVSYLQTVDDVTNLKTGEGNGTPTQIHLEPGLWMHVPATTNPQIGETLTRMASIPHGNTINAQGLQPSTTTTGAPEIPAIDITPFRSDGSKTFFQSQNIIDTDPSSLRIPQDLSKFNEAGTITQEILTDPNTVLRNANANKSFDGATTLTFTVSTKPVAPLLGGGMRNIAFLLGANNAPNADTISMASTFWISKGVTQAVPIPGSSSLETITFTQIQYSQVVVLVFANLAWPHVTVGTLVPAEVRSRLNSL